MVACTPQPDLGAVAVRRGALVQVVDLATCRSRLERAAPPARPEASVAMRRHGRTGSQSILFRGRVVLTVRESFARIPAGAPGPIVVEGVSPDRRWILYAIDPQGSASLAADGLALRAVRAAGGRPRLVAAGLLYPDYRAWCGGRLVLTAGGDRLATHHKRLVAATPPGWRTRPLASGPQRAFGSVACAPDDRSVVVQSQPDTGLDEASAQGHWSLWRAGFDGSLRRLTSPPPGYSDDSPRFAPDGTLFFVRSHGDTGRLYALRHGRLLGPFAQLHAAGYYRHHDWPYSLRR